MSGFNGAAATPVNSNAASKQRDALSVYSKAQVDSAISQATAWVRIADIATSANTAYDNTISVSYPSNCKEVMVTLQRDSNRRTFASTVLPFAQFQNGAAYAGGSYMLYSGLMSNNNTGIYVNAVVIYQSATSIEIALAANTESIRVRVFAR